MELPNDSVWTVCRDGPMDGTQVEMSKIPAHGELVSIPYADRLMPYLWDATDGALRHPPLWRAIHKMKKV